VSVVAPVHGNAAELPELHRRVVGALDGRLRELLLVDDASPDDSSDVMERISAADRRVRVIGLAERSGQHEAVLQGLRLTTGSWVVVMDADLQDPPEAIPLLLRRAVEGVDVVFAGRRGSYESRIRLATSRLYKHLQALATGVPRDAGMFFAASRSAVERLLEMRGPPPFVVAMIGRAGLETASVPVRRSAAGGGSAYSATGRLRSAMRGLRWARWRPSGPEAGPDEIARHNRLQRAYYSRGKRGMVPRHSRYLERHLDELLAFAEIEPGARVLEVGCGQGRYTIPLLDRGYRVDAIDLSPELLDLLRRAAGDRPLSAYQGDILDPPPGIGDDYDAVLGLFALHHMHDVPACIDSMARLLAPGGRLAFLEPNPYNPLYYLQIAVRRSMTWRGDKGMLGMRPAPLLSAVRAAGLREPSFERFGFFPPAVADRPGAVGVERRIERLAPLRPFLPFQLVGGRAD